MSGQYYIYLFAICVLSSDANPLVGPGVKLAEESEFPFIVSLFLHPYLGPKHHLCSGTLISEKHVLTLDYCVQRFNKASVRIVAGTAVSEPFQIYEIERVDAYQDCPKKQNILQACKSECLQGSRPSIGNHIAIITLSKNVEGIVPAVISELNMDEVIRERLVVTAGWTCIDEDRITEPRSLRKVDLEVLSPKEKEYKDLEKIYIDAYSMPQKKYFTSPTAGVALEFSDSGGPLLLRRNKEIVAINDVSLADEDDLSEPTAHIALDRYRDFINSVIKSDCHIVHDEK